MESSNLVSFPVFWSLLLSPYPSPQVGIDVLRNYFNLHKLSQIKGKNRKLCDWLWDFNSLFNWNCFEDYFIYCSLSNLWLYLGCPFKLFPRPSDYIALSKPWLLSYEMGDQKIFPYCFYKPVNMKTLLVAVAMRLVHWRWPPLHRFKEAGNKRVADS